MKMTKLLDMFPLSAPCKSSDIAMADAELRSNLIRADAIGAHGTYAPHIVFSEFSEAVSLTSSSTLWRAAIASRCSAMRGSIIRIILSGPPGQIVRSIVRGVTVKVANLMGRRRLLRQKYQRYKLMSFCLPRLAYVINDRDNMVAVLVVDKGQGPGLASAPTALGREYAAITADEVSRETRDGIEFVLHREPPTRVATVGAATTAPGHYADVDANSIMIAAHQREVIQNATRIVELAGTDLELVTAHEDG